MQGALSRGNLILAASWALAIGMFLAKAGETRGGGAAGARPPQVQMPEAVPAAAVIGPAAVDEAPARDVPVAVDQGEAISRVDLGAPAR